MFTKNIEKERKIFELRRQGLTIDQISFQTGIPRSTVGYHAKKLKKTNASIKTSNRVKENAPTKVERVLYAILHYEISKNLFSMWMQGKYREIRDMIDAGFAIHRLLNQLSGKIHGEEEITNSEALKIMKDVGYIQTH